MLRKKLSLIMAITMTLSGIGVATMADNSVDMKENATASYSEIYSEYNKLVGEVKVVNEGEKGEVSLFIMPNNSSNIYDGVVLHIDEDTRLYDENNIPILVGEIKEGMKVETLYSKIATKSAIPQSVAYSLKVTVNEKDTVVPVEGKVMEIREGKNSTIVSVAKDGKDAYLNGIDLVISNETIVLNERGEEIKVSDLEEGMMIKGYHSIMQTASMPPQSHAIKVVIQEEYNEMEGTIESISESFVNVVAKGAENLMENGVRLIITENTEIVNENGIPLKLEDLHEGMVIDAVYSKAMTRSIPPQAEAYKIIVKNKEEIKSVEFSGKIIGINKADKVTYVSIKPENSKYNEIKLVVNNDTRIMNSKGEKITDDDLKVGMEIKGYHSLAMTFSIPPQTTAYEIVVVDEKVEDRVEFKGEVLDVTDEGDGTTYVRIEKDDSGKILDLIVNNKTEIINEKGNKIKVSDIKVGMDIEGVHDVKETRSYPGQSQAYKLVVDTDDDMIWVDEGTITGKIEDIDEDDNEFEIEVDEKLFGDDEATVIVNEHTQFKGAVNKIEDLEEGMTVEVQYVSRDDDEVVAYIVEVIDKNEDVSGVKGKVEGKIEDIDEDDNEFEIELDEEVFGEDEITVKINKNTKFNGQIRDFDDLKEGMRVKVEYSSIDDDEVVAYKVTVVGNNKDLDD